MLAEKEKTTKKTPEEIMRVFANLLIDNFLLDKRNKKLKLFKPTSNIKLD